MRKLLIFGMTFFAFAFFSAFAATDLLSCEFRNNACSSNEAQILFANKNFLDAEGKVISSNVAIATDSNYNKILCCKVNPSQGGVDLGKMNVTYTTSTCPAGSEDLIYLSGNTNARAALKENVTNFSNYPYKMCISIPTQFSKLNIFTSTTDYTFAGYKCLFRINNVTNGLVSDCNAKYNVVNKYNQIVWAKLIENSDSLKCNSDCTSKLDGRVYEACASKIAECKLVSPACDGSIYGAYVNNGNFEVQCSAPWNNTRNLAFTNEPVIVSSVENKCSNVIQRKYSVLLNNELVTMSVYICGED